MVSKKPATKSITICISIEGCRSKWRRQPRDCSIQKVASAASSVVLTRIGTGKGIKILQKTQTCQAPRPECKNPAAGRPLPPPGDSPPKRTVFLDLDETLVHAVAGQQPERYDFIVRPTIGGKVLTFYVLKRPGVDEFLEKLAKKYEVVVFTAGLREYASLVLDRLDRKCVISHRLYRDSCREVGGRYVKDLAGLGRDMGRLVIVDDNPYSYCFQPCNAVPVRPFIDDMADRELWRLLKFFDGYDFDWCEDMRDAVKQFIAGGSGEGDDDDDDDNGDDDGDDGDDDNDGDDGDSSDDDELGMKSNVSPVIISRPCIKGLRDYFPFGRRVLESWSAWTKMAILCTFVMVLFI